MSNQNKILNAGTVGGAILVILFIVGIVMMVTGNMNKNSKTETVSSNNTQSTQTQAKDTTTAKAIPEKTTQPVPTQNTSVAATGSIFNTLSQSDKKALNTFLSNFSEAGMKRYNSNYPDPDALLWFAYIHNEINNAGSTTYSGGKMGLSASQVDSTISKYFGISLPKKSSAKWQYDGSYYWTDGASGEGHAYFSIAKNLYDNGDGTYTADFNTYMLGYGDEEVRSSYYAYNISQAESDSFCSRTDAGTATMKKNGSQWQLLSLGEDNR